MVKRITFLDRLPEQVRNHLMEVERNNFHGEWDKCSDATGSGDDAVTVLFSRDGEEVARVSMAWDPTGEPTCTIITIRKDDGEEIEPWQA